jgi:hypothetical protein
LDRRLIAALIFAAGFAPSLAEARFSVGAGDLIWSDGQSYTYDEWEEYKRTHPADGSAPKATPVTPSASQQYQQPVAPAEPVYQPQYQTQAPPSASIVNGRPVVTIAPPPVSAPLPIQGAPTVTAVTPAAAPAYAATPVAAPALRAASCRSVRAYAEFPAETEKFDCGAAGSLTRQEMSAQGWRTDFVEKVPAVAGQASPNFYKIILSR